MKVVVLAGGISTERDVSLVSGTMVYQALKKKGHQAILLDVYLGYEGEAADTVFELEEDWAKEIEAVKESNPDLEKVKALRKDGGRSFFGPNVLEICQMADAAFLALHGANGEDGKIQAVFDLMGIRYTGSDSVSSAIAMDKAIAKELMRQNGIQTPEGFRIRKGEEASRLPKLPCVVKSCCGGSSVGVVIVKEKKEYEAALLEAFRYDEEAVVEEYISGREFSVGILDGQALPVIEIAPLQGFYDYKNKYQAGSAVETCPAKLPKEQAEKMQRMAADAFRALRLGSYARMDFMMKEDGEIYCLEANTLPGMTPTSLLPQEACAEGISFEDLCEQILELACRKEGKDASV